MAHANILFKVMLKEEWRVHSTLLGNVNFALFPLLVIAFGFGGSLIMSLFTVIFSKASIVLFAHYVFLFFGANVGAFGLIGKEFMNRRFGQASLIAYSSRTLPVSERMIFFMMVLKDIVYYLFLWIIPLVLGLGITFLILGISLWFIPLLLLTFTLSFLLGLSIVFFLSMLYARSAKFLLSAIVVIGIVSSLLSKNILFSLPPYVYVITHDITQIGISLAVIVILCIISFIFVKFDFPHKVGRFANSLTKLSNYIPLASYYRIFVAKDLIDLERSNGGYGKIFFSFLLPVVFIYAFVGFFITLVPSFNFIIFFSLLLGVYSSTMYTWLTQYDLFNQYLFMPVTVSQVIISKIFGYIFLNIISVAIMFCVALFSHDLLLLPVALLIFAITSFFALSIAILYTGLSPSIMFMDVFVVIKYILSIVPFMSILIVAFFLGTWYLVIGVLIMFILSVIIIRMAFKKWDALPQQTF